MRVFVSYSRHDFNFAEAIAATLRQNDALDPWLDVERLRPGVDWEKALDESLDSADALLLVASPAALASTFVRREWSRALDRGIPVYVGVVKAVPLPDKLARCPKYDLRVRFWRRAAELSRAVSARDMTSPAPHRWRLPGRVPVPLAGLVALSMVNSFVLLWATVLLLGFVTAFISSGRTFATPVGLVNSTHVALAMLVAPMSTAAAAAALVVFHIRLLLRRSTLRMLGTSLSLPFLFGVLFFVFRLEDTLRQIPKIVDAPESSQYMLRILFVVVLVLSTAAGMVLVWSRSVRLWLPADHKSDIDRWAMHVLKSLRLVRATSHAGEQPDFPLWPGFRSQWRAFRPRFAEVPVRCPRPTVEIWCAPADEYVAELVRSACRDAGLTVGPQPGAWVLVLVSSQTDWAEVSDRIRTSGSRAICVQVDSVCVPDEELRRRQWMDFRGQVPEQLFRLLSALRAPEHAEHDYVFLTPITPDRFRAPIGVHVFVEVCRDFLAVIGGITTGTLVVRPFDGRSATLTAISVLLIACTAGLHDRATKRRITAARFRSAAVVTGLVSWAWAATWLWICWDRLVRVFPVFAVQIAAIVGIPLLLPFFLVVIYWYLREAWLPFPGAAAPGRQKAVGAGVWAPYTPLGFVAGFGLAISTAVLL